MVPKIPDSLKLAYISSVFQKRGFLFLKQIANQLVSYSLYQNYSKKLCKNKFNPKCRTLEKVTLALIEKQYWWRVLLFLCLRLPAPSPVTFSWLQPRSLIHCSGPNISDGDHDSWENEYSFVRNLSIYSLTLQLLGS